MSVKGLSDFDQFGNWETDPVWPFNMVLKPNDPCGFPDEWHGSYLDTLTSGCIPSGHDLFEVFAREAPEELGGELYQIGVITTASEMVTSMYGDTKLFFRHVRFEEDLEAKPEWKPFVQIFTRPTFVNNLPLPYDPPADCPFAFLFGLM